MLEILISLLRAQLLSTDYFDKVYGLCVKVREGTKVYPAEYQSKDNYQKVDCGQNFIYFRQSGETQRRQEDEGVTGCDDMVYETVPFVAVAYLPKDIFGSDNPYIDDKVSRNIANYIELAGWNNLRSTLKAEDVHCYVRRVTHFRETVWREEFEGIEMAARHDHVLCSIAFDVEIRSTSGCLQNYECSVDSAVVEPCEVTVYIDDPRAWHRQEGNGESGYLGNFWQLTEDGGLIPVTTETVDVGSEEKKIDNLWVKNLHYDVLIPPLPLSTILAEGNTTGGNNIVITAGDAIESPDGSHFIQVTDDELILAGLDKISFDAPLYEFAGLTDAMLYVDANGLLKEATVTAANGLSLTNGVLAMAAAGAAQAGAVTIGAQNFAGEKTFVNPITYAEGTAKFIVRRWTNDNTYTALYLGNITPSGTNYSMLVQSAGLQTFINGQSEVNLVIAGSGQVKVNSTGMGVGLVSGSPAARAHFRGASNGVALLVEEDGGGDYLICEEVAGVRRIGFFGVMSAPRQTMGAATAGGTYGATEQAMLQKAYDVLRTFGLGD